MSLDTILWLIGLFAEICVVALSLYRKLYRITPVFCSYLAWSVFTDLLFYFLNRYYAQSLLRDPKYLNIYMAQMALDSIFQFAVLVELGWAVLRPIRTSLPRRSILILALIFVIAAAVIWPISATVISVSTNLPKSWLLFFHMQQTVAVLRVVIFLALAGFSQLLSIGWRDRELQIATGLGFYSMSGLAVSMIHSHQTISASPNYHVLDQIGIVVYLCSLGYWAFSFLQQEEKRQDFTPEMRNFLLAMTGAGRGGHHPEPAPGLDATRMSRNSENGSTASYRTSKARQPNAEAQPDPANYLGPMPFRLPFVTPGVPKRGILVHNSSIVCYK